MPDQLTPTLAKSLVASAAALARTVASVELSRSHAPWKSSPCVPVCHHSRIAVMQKAGESTSTSRPMLVLVFAGVGRDGGRVDAIGWLMAARFPRYAQKR